MFNMVIEDSKHNKLNRDNSYAETKKKIPDIEQYIFIFFLLEKLICELLPFVTNLKSCI